MPSGIPKNGVNSGWFKKTRKIKNFICKNCNSNFIDFSKRTFCKPSCVYEYKAKNGSWNKGLKRYWNSPMEFKKGLVPWNKGIKRPEIIGEKHPRWSGGNGKCAICDKQFHYHARKNQRCIECWNKNRGGENSPRWKGGINSVIKRRSQLAGAEGSHTIKQWEELKKKFNYMCLCCKQFEPEIKLSEDHIIPLSKGGGNDISNIQPLCKSCNSIKHVKIINFIEIYDITRSQEQSICV